MPRAYFDDKTESFKKSCSKCQRVLPIGCYLSDKRAKDNLQSNCKECINSARRQRYWEDPEAKKEQIREYRKKNPEVVRLTNKRQREGKNRESILERKRQEYRRNRQDPEWQAKQYKYRRMTKERKREYDKDYVENNREKVNEQARRWSKNNPDKRRAIVFNNASKRRAKMANGPSASEVSSWAAKQSKICYWCGIKCSADYHVDHYFPLASGGEHSIDNLVISCPPCNYRKNAKDPYDFAQEKGRLF